MNGKRKTHCILQRGKLKREIFRILQLRLSCFKVRMVRRHSIPGKFQVYDTSIMNHHRDSVARILPKPLNTVLNTVKNTSAKIHFKSLNLKNVMLREALAAQMMPPPPPPGPPAGAPMGTPEGQVGSIKYVVNNNTNDLILQEGELEFYKNDMETGSVGSGGSASEDFDHEEHMNIIAALGEFFHYLVTTVFWGIFLDCVPH